MRWAHTRWLLLLFAFAARPLNPVFARAQPAAAGSGQGLPVSGASAGAMLAAQTLMLAATARGLDSCPMEGALWSRCRPRAGPAVGSALSCGRAWPSSLYCAHRAAVASPRAQMIRNTDRTGRDCAAFTP